MTADQECSMTYEGTELYHPPEEIVFFGIPFQKKKSLTQYNFYESADNAWVLIAGPRGSLTLLYEYKNFAAFESYVWWLPQEQNRLREELSKRIEVAEAFLTAASKLSL